VAVSRGLALVFGEVTLNGEVYGKVGLVGLVELVGLVWLVWLVGVEEIIGLAGKVGNDGDGLVGVVSLPFLLKGNLSDNNCCVSIIIMFCVILISYSIRCRIPCLSRCQVIQRIGVGINRRLEDFEFLNHSISFS
jgi:hypothetical protein